MAAKRARAVPRAITAMVAPRQMSYAHSTAVDTVSGSATAAARFSSARLCNSVSYNPKAVATRRAFSTEQSKPEEPAEAKSTDAKVTEKPSRWYLMMEDIKDVVAVTFGVTRQRDIGKEVDMGIREYAWVSYVDPASGKTLYRNTDSGLVTEMQPSDWEQRSKASSRLTVNTEASALAVVSPTRSPWERTLDSLYGTPIISGLLQVGEAVAASPVGQAAGKVKAKIEDAKEVALEKWETSQHPYVPMPLPATRLRVVVALLMIAHSRVPARLQSHC